MFDKLRGDYDRHQRRLTNPALWILAVYRYGNWAETLPQPARWVAGKFYGLLDLGIQMTTGSFFPRSIKVGEDLHLIHHFDIRMHPKVELGDRVGIMHEVTVATTQNRPGAPKIGNDVFIGPGAKIIGPVTIGDGATIAPNALVMSDVPPGATAIGVPAKARRITLDLEREREREPAERARPVRPPLQPVGI